MEGEARRNELIKILSDSENAVSGSALAKRLGVSRQVIVQDIALLRAVNKNILATTKGYVLFTREARRYHRSFYVNHSNSEIEDELMTIIDNGGKVMDVIIEHDVYGQISVDLILETPQDVVDFCKALSRSKTKPLNLIANGVHYHTVEAKSEVILDNIARGLKEKGYLISQ